jgi:predicted GIY-YIG superfamily endonuclease
MSKSNTTSARKHCVYKLIFPNGKIYFGITVNFKSRMRSHKHCSVTGGPRPIKHAIKKYGWDNVTGVIIAENLLTDEAYKMEQQLIKEYKTQDIHIGYNLADGGRTNVGYKHKGVWNKGKKLSEGHIQALRNSKKGNDYSAISSQNSTRYPVIATNRYTGEIKKFINATKCGEYLGISPCNVYNHIYRNSKYLIKEWTVRRPLNQKVGY